MHVDGQSFLLDDYKSLTSFGTTGTVDWTQEKGHREELIALHKNGYRSAGPESSGRGSRYAYRAEIGRR